MDQEQLSRGQTPGHHKTAFYIVAVLIAAALAFGIWLAAQPLYPITDNTAVLWDAGRGDADWEVYTMEKGQKKSLTYDGSGYFSGLAVRGQTFFAARQITEEYAEALLSIDTPYRFALYLNGELLYTQEPVEDSQNMAHLNLSGELSGAPVPVVVPLPEGYAGCELTIVQAQRGPEEDPLRVQFGPVSISGKTRAQTGLSSEALRSAYPAVLLLVLACVLAGAFLFSVYNGKPDAPSLYLFLCTLLWMGSVLCSSEMLHQYYEWTGPLAQLFYYDGYAFMFLFLAEQMRRFAKLMYIFAALYAVFFALGLVAEYFLPADTLADVLTQIPDLLTTPVLVVAIVLAFVEAKDGNRDYTLFTRLFLVGFTAYLVALLVSFVRGGLMWTSFLDGLREGLETWRFTYVLDVLRYILVAACFVCTTAQFIRSAIRRGADRAMIRQRIRLAEQQYLDLERHARKEAATRQDVRRHLSIIGDYIDAGTVDLAQLYMNQMSVALERTTTPVATRNPVVDTILNAKVFEAREAGIDVNIQTGHLPRVLPLSQADLAAVLINTLDNAIAAARKSREKTMAIKAYMHQGFFCYRCENSMARMDEDASGRGYGLQIVEEIADAHDASMIFEQGQHIFVLSLAFPTPSAAQRTADWSPIF